MLRGRSVEQKPSFPHCAEAPSGISESLLVAWHGPLRPMITLNHMEEWPDDDSDCSMKEWASHGGHATRFLSISAAVSPTAVAANCRGVYRTCGRESLGKETTDLGKS